MIRVLAVRMLLAVTLFLLANCAPRPMVTVGGGRGCGEDNPWAHRVVEKFLTSPSLAQDRAKVGLVSPSTIRVLNGERDSGICNRLRAVAVGEGPFSFYASGGIYFVVGRRPTSSEFTPLALVGPDFCLLSALAM
jgi:hypothetical protein